MACPVLLDPESGSVVGMVKIEELEHQALTLSTFMSLRFLCDFISRLYVLACRFEKAVTEDASLSSDAKAGLRLIPGKKAVHE